MRPHSLMQYIDNLDKYYYCPLKRNRRVDDTAGQKNYQAMEALNWSQTELDKGKIIKIKSFPNDKKVKLFRGKSLYRQNGIHSHQ